MRNQHHSEQGVYLVFFALSVFTLFGFVALAIDIARQMSVHSELQNAADACAISAVSELNGSSDSTKRATLAGIFVGNQNLQNFQNSSVAIQASDIFYSTSISGAFTDSTSSPSSTSTFVKCNVNSSGFLHFFAVVLGIPDTILSASSVATLLPSSTVLALPLAINKGSSNPSSTLGYTQGDNINFVWDNTGTVTASLSSTTLTVTTNTTLVELNSLISGTGLPSGSKVVAKGTGVGLTGTYTLNNGATLGSRTFSVAAPPANSFYFASESSITNAANEIQKFGLMNTNVTANISITNFTNAISGASNTYLMSFEDAWNSRFGLYRTGTSFSSTTLPDLSGYFVYTPTTSTWSDYVTNEEPLRTAASTLSSSQFASSTSTLTSRAASNRRYIALPVVIAGQVQGWACTLMVHPELKGSTTDSQSAMIQYIGPASSLGSPCRSFGLPGNQAGVGPLVPTIVQ